MGGERTHVGGFPLGSAEILGVPFLRLSFLADFPWTPPHPQTQTNLTLPHKNRNVFKPEKLILGSPEVTHLERAGFLQAPHIDPLHHSEGVTKPLWLSAALALGQWPIHPTS